MPQGDELGYGDIYGAGTSGGEDFGSIVDYLFGMLSNAGWFGMEEGDYGSQAVQMGANWQSPGVTETPFGDFTTQGGWTGFGGMPLGGEQNIAGITNWLEALGFGEGGTPSGSLTEEQAGGLGGFHDLLQSLDLGGRSLRHKQDIGDMRSEIGAQMGALRKNYPTMQKGSRYGGLGGASRKNLGGSRRDYMSDIYGLEKQQQQMTANLQEGFESDFYTDVSNFLTQQATPTYG